MKSLLEFRKYAPVLFTFLFLAAVFASCHFDPGKPAREQKASERYDQLYGILLYINMNYYDRTQCKLSNPPGQTMIPASNPDGFRCIISSMSTSGYYFIINFDTGQVIPANTFNVNAGTKLICKCKDSQPPLTEENPWYKRNQVYQDRADPFFTHSYQKDSNGNITGVDPFIPTQKGDVFLCLPKCGRYPIIYEMITIQ